MSAESGTTRRAREPKAQPVARYVAMVIGVVLLAVAVICARELWLRNSADVDWDSWVDPVVLTIGAATFEPWMLPIGVLAVVLGALLMWIGVRPRTRTHRRLGSPVPLWMRPTDIARLSSAQARRVAGVLSAHSQVSGKTLTVTIIGGAEDTGLSARVEEKVTSLLEELGLALALRVRVRPHPEVRR